MSNQFRKLKRISSAQSSSFFSFGAFILLSDYDDYGRYKTEESGIKIGELGDLEDFVNFWDYGEHCKKDNKAVFLDSYGVLENSGSEFTERYNGDLNTIPKEYSIVPSQQKWTQKSFKK